MHARFPIRLGRAATLSFAMMAPALAWAGGGGHGGAVFHAGGGFHGGGSGGGFRGLPPVSGVIHERPGMRPYVSAYGHTDTAARGGYGRAGFGGYGHTNTAFGFAGDRRAATAVRPFGAGRAGFAGLGHVATAVPAYALNRPGFIGRGMRDRSRFGSGRGGFAYRYGGGYGGDIDGGFGGYGGYADAGTYGGGGTYGAPGTYGIGGTYGSGYSSGGYASETPLAARFAEAPLAPSPGAPYSPADNYAYAVSEDLGYGSPRILTVGRAMRPGCDCGPVARVEPVVYRYGVGTAY